jgi:molybdopterin-containing oxidoreductase family iron-sulfur binding subunit
MSDVDNKHYWKVPADRDGGESYRLKVINEFPEELDLKGESEGINRRSFLKATGFAFAGAVVAQMTGCSRPPEQKIIPFLEQPEEIIPGREYWYASTCHGCSAGCGILTRNLDGRPVKLEGNPHHPLSKGGLCAVGQASILPLYDSHRLRIPMMGGNEAKWEQVDQAIVSRLAEVRQNGGAVRFLSSTVNSPTLRRSIREFLAGFPGSRHIQYDALSSSAIQSAHQATHGSRILPHYRFDRARMIVSFDADFLGTWISPVEFTRDYADGRSLKSTPPVMSLHVQVESRMSLTGSSADRRHVVTPRECDDWVALLASKIARLAGQTLAAPALDPQSDALIDELANQLWHHRGQSLIVSGSNRTATQVHINRINHLLGNEGQTVDLAAPSRQRQGDDAELETLRQEIAAGKVLALFILNANPAYDLPDFVEFAQQVQQIPLVVSFADRLDETASLAHFVCPDHHYLESWHDQEPVAGLISITQPSINPLHQTRAVVESLALWRGKPADAHTLMQQTWKEDLLKRQNTHSQFQTFWDQALQMGFAQVQPESPAAKSFNGPAVAAAASTQPSVPSGKLALVLYPTIGMLDGRNAHNAWLHELPDPVTKVTWDNYASFSPATAASLGITEGDVVRLADDQVKIELPAHLQPGQNDQVVAVALGYGRKGTDRFAFVGPQWLESKPTVEPGHLVGRNAASFLTRQDNQTLYSNRSVQVERTGARHALASTQLHHSIDVPANLASPDERRRPIVEETTLAALAKDPHAGANHHELFPSLWAPDHKYPGHKWGMSIDMNACTGCSACVVACQIENNVPVVGKDEIARQREMHWIRIDRYYTSEGYDTDVAHQPMLCQHCENATCETVCPVLATVHSSEGINQQVYNRCVGTRYCANNCAYKVRRFNWFNYAHEDQMQNMVLNPEVTVRSRGVMEKCSFCIQRISNAKARAKEDGRPLADGDVKTACQQSCPAQAIVFGDLNDPNSQVSQMRANGRSYRVLEELKVEPSIGYLRIVRNRPQQLEESHV